jgi:hypothetical protein
MGELAALSTAIGTLLSAAVLWLSSRYANRRILAETEKLRVETGSSLQEGFAKTAAMLAESARAELESVRHEIERVRHERDAERAEVDRLRCYVAELVGLMRGAGMKVPMMKPAAVVAERVQ